MTPCHPGVIKQSRQASRIASENLDKFDGNSWWNVLKLSVKCVNKKLLHGDTKHGPIGDHV
jgi:hypothetical protein